VRDVPPATSARDPRIARAARLLRAPAPDAFVVDGADLLHEARAAGLEVEVVFARADTACAGDVVTAPDALRALAALGQPPEVAAIVRTPARPPLPLPPRSLVLAGVTDAGNVGSIVRTAGALGLPRVEVLEGSADPWSRKALRAALGASFAPGLVATGRTLEELRGGVPLAAAVPRGGVPPEELPPGAAVVLGSERHGLSAEERAACDVAVTVPAPGFESLNVAAAAAILAWELARTAAAAGDGKPGAGERRAGER